MKKETSIMTIMILGVGILSGCNSSNTVTIETSTVAQETIDEELQETQSSEDNVSVPTLFVGYNGDIDSLNPLFADTYDSKMITGLTQVTLLTTDRNGDIIYKAINGETIIYKGSEYYYEGIADIDVEYDEEENQTVYTITLRSDLRFNDGTEVNADDLIFTLYALSDPTYDGPYTVYSMPIVGMKSYRSNAPANIIVTEDEMEQTLAVLPEDLKGKIIENIIRMQLTEELEWCRNVFEDEEYELLTKQYDSYLKMFVSFYARKEVVIEENAEESQVLESIIAQYDSDYKALGKACYNDETAFVEETNKLVESWIIEDKISRGLIGNAPNISGIQKINDYEITITTEGYDATAIYQLDIPIMPLHYYGKEDLYNYENNQFGFIKEDLSNIYNKNVPMGAGPYQFVSSDDETISMVANEYYYGDVIQTKKLQFVMMAEDEKIEAVASGSVDVARIVSSIDNVEEIMKCNSNDSLTGDVLWTNMVDELSYGYIGINAENVSVGGDADSEESIYLRTALATIFSYYRESAVESYFGASANVINYPMSKTLWASPKKSDSDYETAFSKDINDNLIYTDGMTEEENLIAVKEATLEYLQAAGYEVTEGVVIKAPKGASLEYEVILAQEKGAVNPCGELITQAAKTLNEIGITLNIRYLSSQAELVQVLKANTQQIWCAESSTVIYPDLYKQYYSANCPEMGGTNENFFCIRDEKLDILILKARQDDDRNARKILYKQSLDLIMDWAVEVPVYQSTDNVLYNAKRIDVNTIAQDVTSYYSWLQEIEDISLQTENIEIKSK